MTSPHELTPLVSRLFASSSWSLDATASDRLAQYLELLLRWSKRVNLTGHRTAETAAEGLLYDAAEIAPLLPPEATVLDIGAGAGGLAFTLATLRKDVHLRLVEPRTKRAVFLRTARRELGYAENIEIIATRAEQLEEVHLDGVVAAYAQAVFPPDKWLELGPDLLPSHGTLLCLTAKPLTELIELPPDLEIREERHYTLPFSASSRVVTALGIV